LLIKTKEKRKMEKILPKTKIVTAIFMILLMTSLILMVSPSSFQPIKTAKAQTVLPTGVVPTNNQSQGSIPLPTGVTPDVTINDIAHVAVSPKVIGLKQPLLVNLWMNPALEYHYFTGYTVTFTKPDGSKETVGPMNSLPADTTAWFNYYPDQVGVYSYIFNFPGGFYPAGNYSVPAGTGAYVGAITVSLPQSVYYTPSSDGPYNFTVQSQPVMSWPPSPLPGAGDYWTTPISVQNREWWPLGGWYPATGVVEGYAYNGAQLPSGYNWPAGQNPYMSNYAFTPYVTGPTSAHVLWARMSANGGLMGGEGGIYAYTNGGMTGTFTCTPNMIYNGRCYQTVTKVMPTLVNGTYINIPTSVWQCYDLYTGAIYWEQTGVPGATMWIQEQALPEVAGGGSNYPGTDQVMYAACISNGYMIKYNLYTGAVFQNISIAPLTTGTFYKDTDEAYFLTVQNLGAAAAPNQYRLINWSANGVSGAGATITNIGLHIYSNITWPFASLGSVDYQAGIAATTYNYPSPATDVTYKVGIEACSLTTGALLWNMSDPDTFGYATYSTTLADHGELAVHFTDGHIYCYNLNTGSKLWKSPDLASAWPWDKWFAYGSESYGGMIIQNEYAGIVAYNWTNGNIVWSYRDPNVYNFETPYGGYETFFTTSWDSINGINYAVESEHTPTEPESRSWKVVATNLTDGTNIWQMPGDQFPGPVCDGYLTTSDAYDGYMYVYGMGTSATTVSAPTTAQPAGTPILIQGTVYDTSPGIQNPTVAAAGSSPPLLKNRIGLENVPCVSDASMTTQMSYLYMQLPINGVGGNETITGVPIALSSTGPDGTVYQIGTTTTNGYSGTYSISWTPPSAGNYTITANFEGTDSYGRSNAATAILMTSAPTETITPTASGLSLVTTSDLMMYQIAAAIAIIIAIAIVGALLLRKRQ
jgi:hypothetical protein